MDNYVFQWNSFDLSTVFLDQVLSWDHKLQFKRFQLNVNNSNFSNFKQYNYIKLSNGCWDKRLNGQLSFSLESLLLFPQSGGPDEGSNGGGMWGIYAASVS